jgi:ATP-dependent DNA helicase RecG
MPEPAPDSAATAMTLTTPVHSLPWITRRQAEGLASLGLTNLGRLIAHLPMRHEHIQAETAIADLVVGEIISTRGEITATRIFRKGPKSRFVAALVDSTGRVDLVFFNQAYMADKLKPGLKVRVFGKLDQYQQTLQIVNPRIEKLDETAPPEPRDARLRPVYPAGGEVTSATIERAIARSLDAALPLIEDHLSPDFRAARAFPELRECYRMQHATALAEDLSDSRRRLAYDELFMLQLGVFLKRHHLRSALQAPVLAYSPAIDRAIRERLHFELTPHQNEVIAEIVRDVTQSRPANRLIQGDVGSGKTVVALYAMLLAVAGGHQAALMAPTEILAEQHLASISRVLDGSRVRLALLTGSLTKSQRDGVIESIKAGQVDIVVGTHALLTEGVEFKTLAVAVIDEQHRFGVQQRATLRARGSDATSTPHVLVMTATPIPRTLAITLFGDLDVSTIGGLPPGRRAVTTTLLGMERRDVAYAHAAERIARGEQCYIVAPAVQPESAAGGVAIRSVPAIVEDLKASPLSHARIGIMHAQLAREEREETMRLFRAGEIDVLVATTVIEVGVDVPNATVIIIEQADRFGLAQLHQLRGRVGRSDKPSECFLIANPVTPVGIQRLRVMETTSDGFRLAEEDLNIRGPGEVFGSRQSGLAPFKVADLVADRELLAMARKDAASLIRESPMLDKPGQELLRRRLLKAHGEDLGLGDVG